MWIVRDQEAWRCVLKADLQRFRGALDQAALAFLRESEEEWEIPAEDALLPGENLEHTVVRSTNRRGH